MSISRVDGEGVEANGACDLGKFVEVTVADAVGKFQVAPKAFNAPERLFPHCH